MPHRLVTKRIFHEQEKRKSQMSAEFNTVMYRDVDSQLSVAHAALKTALGFFFRLDRAKSDEKILEIVKDERTMLWCVYAGMSGLYDVLKNGFGIDAEEDESFKIKSVNLLAMTSAHLHEEYKKAMAKKEDDGNEKETK